MSTFDLAAFSDAIADLAGAAQPLTASLGADFTYSGFHWGDDLYVTAEERVGDGEGLGLNLGGGEKVAAELVGRDPSTGVALLRTDKTDATAFKKAAPVRAGNLVIAVGNAEGHALASFGSVGIVGPAWRSMRGGTIDRRINLAISLGARFEGGPVLDAKGALVGMLLFGPRRRALVMPYETIERAVATLLEKGHVARGYLGAGLHPIRQGGTQGAMVMSLDEAGPAKAAGLALGDIVTAWNGEALRGPRDLIRRLGPDTAGQSVTLTVLRGGESRDVAVTIGEKPLS